MMQKIIMTCDHTSEVLFYLAILYYRKMVNKSKNLKDNRNQEEAKPIEHSQLLLKNNKSTTFQKHRTFINLLKHLKNLPHSYLDFVQELWNASEDDWDIIFRYICAIQIVAVWFSFSLMYFFFPEMGFVQFVIFIYFPGTVFVIVSLIAPFCFRSTLSSWDWSNIFDLTPKHVQPLPHTHHLHRKHYW